MSQVQLETYLLSQVQLATYLLSQSLHFFSLLFVTNCIIVCVFFLSLFTYPLHLALNIALEPKLYQLLISKQIF